MSPKFKKMTATIEIDYLIPMINNDKTEINGWTIKQVIEDWFNNNPLYSYHATRDGHAIGNSERIKKITIEDFKI